MATNKLIFKKSSVSDKVPTTTDLDYGELALNYADGKLFYKKSDGTTIDSFSSKTYAGVTPLPSTPQEISLEGITGIKTQDTNSLSATAGIIVSTGSNTASGISAYSGTLALNSGNVDSPTEGSYSGNVGLFSGSNFNVGGTGIVTIQTGSAAQGTSGSIFINNGQSNSAFGSSIEIHASNTVYSTSGYGGTLYLYGGNSSSTTTSAIGGSVRIYGGRTTSTNSITKTGGSVYIDGGAVASGGTGNAGSIYIGAYETTIKNTAAIYIGKSNTTTTLSGSVKALHIGSTGYIKIDSSGNLSSTIPFTHSNTPPTTPIIGDRWLNSNNGIEYTYVDDGDSSQWVDLSSPSNGTPVFVQSAAPNYSGGSYMWIQTDVNGGFTIWVEDGQ